MSTSDYLYPNISGLVSMYLILVVPAIYTFRSLKHSKKRQLYYAHCWIGISFLISMYMPFRWLLILIQKYWVVEIMLSILLSSNNYHAFVLFTRKFVIPFYENIRSTLKVKKIISRFSRFV